MVGVGVSGSVRLQVRVRVRVVLFLVQMGHKAGTLTVTLTQMLTLQTTWNVPLPVAFTLFSRLGVGILDFSEAKMSRL